MYRVGIAVVLFAGSLGCHGGWRLCYVNNEACPPTPEACPSPAPPPVQSACAPPTRVEVQSPETVVVKAPPQKIVVETPAATAAAVPAQAPAMHMGMSGMPMAAMGYGMGNAPVTGQVRERTRLGFVVDTIRIPIPWLRPIPVQQPAEVTLQMPTMTATTMSTGFAAPMMPMQVPMGMNVGMMAPPTVPMAPVPVTGMALATGHMVVPGQGVVQGQGLAVQGQGLAVQGQGLAVQPAGAAGQQNQTGNAAALAAGQQNQAGGAGWTAPQDRVKAAAKQIEELEKMCEDLKKLKQQLGEKK